MLTFSVVVEAAASVTVSVGVFVVDCVLSAIIGLTVVLLTSGMYVVVRLIMPTIVFGVVARFTFILALAP